MKKIAFIVFSFLIFLNSSQAKWASSSDAVSKVTYNAEINVNKDGTFEQTQESTTQILTETARNSASQIILHYSEDSQELKIIEAKTVYKGREYYLDKNLIEDKPLASSPQGFDQMRQVLLAFPKIEVGSIIHLKYRLIQKKPNLAGFFASTFSFGEEGLLTKAKVKINSKLPIYFLTNDPDGVLKVSESKNKAKGLYNLKIDLKKPIFKNAINEPVNSIVNDKHQIWVSVSSLDKWQDLAVRQSDGYEKVLAQKMPKGFKNILKKAKSKKNDVDKINAVTSLLNDQVRYLGDWRSVNGRFIPRDLATVAKTHLADCKDFSAITAAILNKLGFCAQVALVMRGIDSQVKHTLPDIGAFNHAMVKAVNKEGKTYWIDPTNFESMAGGIFPDIAGKKVLILDSKKPKYENIPHVDFKRAKTTVTKELSILSNNEVVESGNLKIENESALGFVGAGLKVSKDIIKNHIFNMLAGKNLADRDKKKLDLPKLNSRIVDDVSFSYSFVRRNEILKTNAGLAIKLNYGLLEGFYNLSLDYVSDVFIGSFPLSFKRQTVIKNIRAKNIELLNCEKSSPWAYVKRKCFLNKDGELQIDDTFMIYKSLIPNEDLKKQEFIDFKNWLVNKFKDVILVFEQADRV